MKVVTFKPLKFMRISYTYNFGSDTARISQVQGEGKQELGEGGAKVSCVHCSCTLHVYLCIGMDGEGAIALTEGKIPPQDPLLQPLLVELLNFGIKNQDLTVPYYFHFHGY